jgi:thioredoxin reductase (NADPH)
MSRYLVDRINGLANVEVVTQAQVSGLAGTGGMLETLRWRAPSGEAVRQIRHLFLFIGADPNSDWLAGALKLDAKGFVLTGAEAGASRQLLETSRHGVFAIGDVRAGSVKRVAAAVGEGAQVVAMLHSYLAGEVRKDCAMTERYLEDYAVGQKFGSGQIRVDKERIKAFAAEFDPQPFPS